MNLTHLNDHELLSQTRLLVQNERQVLTKILHHLREVERRKLFSDLGHRSLFEYAVKELKYSEGQAGRRIQAMRLIKELPQVEQKIESGRLSLSNVSQAQSYFREVSKAQPERRLESETKLKVLEELENKSAREGQKVLVRLQPLASHSAAPALTSHSTPPLPSSTAKPETPMRWPRERERILTDSHTEVRFIMTEDLKNRLEELRSLLGIKGLTMSFSELVDYMANVSLRDIKIKKFGKKRVEKQTLRPTPTSELTTHDEFSTAKAASTSKDAAFGAEAVIEATSSARSSSLISATPTSELVAKNHRRREEPRKHEPVRHESCPIVTPEPHRAATCESRRATARESHSNAKRNSRGAAHRVSRYIPKEIRYQVWCRDQGRCTNCGQRRNLNIDHIKPVALGGDSTLENLRLLCFHCNQRQAMRIFGVDSIECRRT